MFYVALAAAILRAIRISVISWVVSANGKVEFYKIAHRWIAMNKCFFFRTPRVLPLHWILIFSLFRMHASTNRQTHKHTEIGVSAKPKLESSEEMNLRSTELK